MNETRADHQGIYQRIVDRFVGWAEDRDDIRAAMIVGSRARTDRPADAWSDLDLVIFTSDPAFLLGTVGWLDHIGEPVITFLEPAAVGSFQERRVLFDGAIDVDFVAVPVDMLDALATLPADDPMVRTVREVVSRGHRVVLDKDDRLSAVAPGLAIPPDRPHSAPTQERFTETLSDFWYHAIWIAKKLARGEVFGAHECLDSLQRGHMLRLIRWQAEGNGTTWHGTRFLESWVDPHVLELLPATWARHDRDDIARAMEAMMDVVAWLATELAASTDLSCSPEKERAVRHWFREITGSD